MKINGINFGAEDLLDHATEGIYIVDLDCRIIYWNKSAERITGYKAENVVGKRCQDDILVHIDRQGEPLCNPGRCPLSRAMQADGEPLKPGIVFAKTADGARRPVSVSVSPLKDELGNVVGGVEVFRDESKAETDREQAYIIQHHIVGCPLPKGYYNFHALYRPQEQVGGDYYQVSTLGNGSYAFMLADVAGHGVPAALYTMTLHSLWQNHFPLLAEPPRFMSALNEELNKMVVGDRFATAVAGVLNPRSGHLSYASAGHPPALLCNSKRELQELPNLDMPLGALPGIDYTSCDLVLGRDEAILYYTDAALETTSPKGVSFGEKRLNKAWLQGLNSSGPEQSLDEVEKALHYHAQNATLEDDLTLLMISGDSCA